MYFLSLLLFNHGFIQTRFGPFELFWFCFMSNKYYLMLLIFSRYLIDEKRTQGELNTKVKGFHETISCLMKCPWNYIS